VLRSGRIIRFDPLALADLEEAMRSRYEPSPAPLKLPRASYRTVRNNAYEDVLKLTKLAIDASRKKKRAEPNDVQRGQ
jgi:hypothetical protein